MHLQHLELQNFTFFSLSICSAAVDLQVCQHMAVFIPGSLSLSFSSSQGWIIISRWHPYTTGSFFCLLLSSKAPLNSKCQSSCLSVMLYNIFLSAVIKDKLLKFCVKIVSYCLSIMHLIFYLLCCFFSIQELCYLFSLFAYTSILHQLISKQSHSLTFFSNCIQYITL